jgi:hypothetical protein
MKFGKVFRYQAELKNGQSVIWKVFAETRTEADAKVDAYLAECKCNGYYDAPVKVKFSRVEDDLVLY